VKLAGIIGCFLFCSIAIGLHAQYTPAERRQLKTANSLLDEGKFNEALPLYLRLDSVIDDIMLRYHIGICYLNSSFDKLKAIGFLEEASRTPDVQIPTDVYLYLGTIYHYVYRFNDAITEFDHYIKKAEKEQVINIDNLNYCKRMITICNNAIEITSKVYKAEIELLGTQVNTMESEYCPMISADEKILLLMRTVGIGKVSNPESFILISAKDENNEWKRPEKLAFELDSKLKKLELKLAGLSPDGRTIFLNFGTGLDQDLYTGSLIGNAVVDIKKLNKNINSPFFEGRASITPDGTRLFFVSDRPGGLGGTDIYESKLNRKGEWDEPKNLGDSINTKFDEQSPFIHPDNQTLFFSSQGHNTIGGFDIFKSKFQNGKWSTPENMGFPNSTKDDLYFVLNASGQSGYFSSSKNNAYDKHNILKANFKDPIPLTVVKGTIQSGNPPKPIGASIKVFDKETQEQIKYVYNPDPLTGKYLLIFPPAKNYQLIISSPDFLPQLVNVHIPYQTYFYELYQEITLSPIILNNANIGEEITVNNTFYDVYKTVEADSLLGNDGPTQPNYYEHLLELVENIIQTTDTIQKISYRDISVDNKQQKENTDRLLNLIEEAIETTDPITLSILDANTKQKEKVTETHFYTDGSKAKSAQIQVIGNETFYTAPPVNIHNYDPQMSGSYLKTEGAKGDNPVMFKLSKPSERNIIYKYMVYYDLNKDEISLKGQAEIEQIINILIDNPSVGAEINGFADAKGEEMYNLNLSRQRAQNILKYLINHKVDGRKLITKGFGEEGNSSIDKNTGKVNYRRVEINLFELKK
jgi:outer membrane protein OmpA-like peptidoglycan-associated protein